MTTIVFLDTETDGLHPGRKVWEIAMIRRDEQGESESTFFVDIDLSTADPFGLNVGRFYDRHPLGRCLADAAVPLVPVGNAHFRTALVAAQTVARWTHGAHIVGAVPNFDTEVLAALLRRHGFTPAWHYHLIDVEALAVGWLYGRDAVLREQVEALAPPVGLPWKSDDLSRACGVEPPGDEERHTAMGDARWAMRLYDAIVGAA